MGHLRDDGLTDWEERSFALCLTHDVDRLWKTIQAPYRAVRDLDPWQLLSMIDGSRPYWQFDTMMTIEESYGVRSSVYFLQERQLLQDCAPRAVLDPRNWLRYTGHYRLDHPEITAVIRILDAGGWEIGLHASYASARLPDRLREEKQTLESVLGDSVLGGRHHFLNVDPPDTWRLHRSMGLAYDSSLGSSTTVGFDYGYDVVRPFEDDFLVFPITVMDAALHSPGTDTSESEQQLDRLIDEAIDSRAVMTVLWHPRLFNQREFPGYRSLYEYLLDRAVETHAWIGPIESAYRHLTTSPSESISTGSGQAGHNKTHDGDAERYLSDRRSDHCSEATIQQ